MIFLNIRATRSTFDGDGSEESKESTRIQLLWCKLKRSKFLLTGPNPQLSARTASQEEMGNLRLWHRMQS